MKILWHPSFAIGIEALDQQHRQIIDVLSDLNRPDHQVEFDLVAGKITSYVDAHFTFESRLMEL